MRSGSARKSGKAKAGGGDSHPLTHTRFRLPDAILGEGGSFSVPTRAAPAGVSALRPLNNVTPAAPVPGTLSLRAGGVKLHLGPAPPRPNLFLRSRGRGTAAGPVPVFLTFANGAGGSGHRPALCFLSLAGGAGLGFPPAGHRRGRGPEWGWLGGWGGGSCRGCG